MEQQVKFPKSACTPEELMTSTIRVYEV